MPVETIVVTENPVSSWEQYEQTLVKGAGFGNEQITHRDMGGFWQASFDYIPHDREDALSFLNNALGRAVVFYNEAGNTSWEGFINTITMRTGTATIKNTLNTMANRVWVRYTPVGGGVVTRSTVIEDLTSQGRYGIKEQVIAGGEISSDVADQIAELYLDNHFWPFPQLDSIDLAGTPLEHPVIQVVCYGWFRTLEWRVYNQTIDTGTQNAGQQEQDIVGVSTFTPGTLKDDLLGWWTLDEYSDGSGAINRFDSSGNNLTLSDNGTLESIAGKVQLAGDFELADTTGLSRADPALLSFGDEDFTVCAWVKLESKPGAAMDIVAKWQTTGNNREYILRWVSGPDRFRFTISNDGTATTNVDANTVGAPVLGTWYFVIVEHDSVANTITIEVNDGGVDSQAYANGCNDNVSSFCIGANIDESSNWFDGVIDETAVWGRTLTASERTALYNNGNGVGYDNIGIARVTGGVGQFIRSAVYEANPTVVTREYDADRKAADICTAIADLGDDQFRAFICGCEEDRAFYYKEAAPPVRIV